MSVIDYDLINTVTKINLVNLLKLIIISYFLFYWIPNKILPQNYVDNTLDRVMYNILFSLFFTILVIPQLVFFKIFSLVIYIFLLILLKLLFIKYYEKKSINKYFAELKKNILIGIFDFFDNASLKIDNFKQNRKDKFKIFYEKLTIYKFFRTLIYIILFTYAIFNIGIQAITTFSDGAPDTAFFVNWVTEMEKNLLWSDNNSFGSDFYGMTVFIFYLLIWSNIDIVILFKIYPLLLIFFYHFALYYVVYKVYNSNYTAIVAVMIASFIFFSPLSMYFAGHNVTLRDPRIITLFDIFNFYTSDTLTNERVLIDSHIPYTRYSSGLGYEFANAFFLLNLFFLSKMFEKKENIFILLYGVTLFFVFSFHGGGVVFLLPSSLLVLLNALIFKKYSISLIKKGLISAFTGIILGNLWILSMFKYGLPDKIGNALPVLDKYLSGNDKFRAIEQVGNVGIDLISFQFLELLMMFVYIAMLIFVYFSKHNKFLKTSIVLSLGAVFLVYYLPHLSGQKLVAYSRGIEYLYILFIIILTTLYYYSLNFLFKLIFKKYYATIQLIIFYFTILFCILFLPKWYNNNNLPEGIRNVMYPNSVDSIGYSATAKVILDINTLYRPYTWTLVSYVQEYSKVKNKGFHLNLHNFLKRYNPSSEYLEVPTRYIFIVEEVSPNSYRGLGEWWYRWKRDLFDNLRTWIATYKVIHQNETIIDKKGNISYPIGIFMENEQIKVYIIDNEKYLEKLRKDKEEKDLNGNYR